MFLLTSLHDLNLVIISKSSLCELQLYSKETSMKDDQDIGISARVANAKREEKGEGDRVNKREKKEKDTRNFSNDGGDGGVGGDLIS